MAAYTITSAQNISELTGKTGGDTYTINGGTLTIDQDSRYGVNSNTSSTLGSITISSTLGGVVNFDGRFVRLIAYTGGSGTVPTAGTTISHAGASGTLIGVWSSISVAPTAAGAAMPATGFIKIKEWNSIPYTAGALTGITAISSGPDTAGWLEIIGDDAGTFTIPRLGQWSVQGEWFDLGSTTGSNTGTHQFPTSGLLSYPPGVFVETSPGSGEYEFYPSTGTATATAANFSRDFRSKVCFITTTGLLRFGADGTNTTGGYIPPAGCKIRVGNVFLLSATTANRTINTIPNATIASRYETLTTSAGVLNIDKASVGWYLNMSQAYSVTLSNTVVCDTIVVSEIASPMYWDYVGVGQSAAVNLSGLTINLCFAGGIFNNCFFTRTSLSSSGFYVFIFSDSSGFTFNNLETSSMTPARGNASTGAIAATRVSNCVFNNFQQGGGKNLLTTCSNIAINNTLYYDNNATNTLGSFGCSMVELSTACSNITIDGVSFGGLYLTQPLNGILSIGTAGCTNIKLRNLGTYAAPLSLGSPRRDDQPWVRAGTVATITSVDHGFQTGDTIFVVVSSNTSAISVAAKSITSTPTSDTYTFAATNSGDTSGTICYFGTKCSSVFTLATGAAANDVRVQRVFAPHTRTNLYTMDNSSKNILLANVFSDYLNIPIMVGLNMINRNVSGTPTLASQAAVYGTHWWNGYTCDVASNTVDCAWTRVGTTITVTSPGHSLRTTTASSSTSAVNIPISITASSNEAALPRGVQNFVTAVDSSTFRITGINSGATSGTMSYRVGNGRIGIVMNEKTAETSQVYQFTGGNPAFTSAGTLYMPSIGDQVVFTTPEYLLGQGNTFPIMELQIGGSTLTRYNFDYKLDKNDGAGFGAWHNLYYERTGGSGSIGNSFFNVTDATGVEIGDYVWGTGVANKTQVTNIVGNTITVDDPNVGNVSGTIRFNHLPSETDLGPSTGIKMQWRITTKTANTVGINFLYIFAESTDLGRAALYPLDTLPIKVTVKDVNTGLPIEGARVILKAAPGGPAPVNTVLLTGLTNSSGEIIGETEFVNQPLSGNIRKATIPGDLYKPSLISDIVDSSGFSTTVLMIRD